MIKWSIVQPLATGILVFVTFRVFYALDFDVHSSWRPALVCGLCGWAVASFRPKNARTPFDRCGSE